MFPVLFSAAGFAVSSFGVFFALAFMAGVFLTWRLARAWDLEEEKLLDLILLTIFGGLIISRIYFIFENFSFFNFDVLKWLLFYKYPGFSFWGGFLGGWLTLAYFSFRSKLDFYFLADIAAVGFLAGLSLVNIGCFLGGCNIGVVSNSFWAVAMVGVIGKRFPVQILEAILLFILVWKLWSQTTHFHKSGKIAAFALIFLGLIQLVLSPLKDSSEQFFSLSIFILGIVIFYRVTKRNILADLKLLSRVGKLFIISPEFRKKALIALQKSWYNHKVLFLWRLKNFSKILRRLNVYFSHKDSKFN